MMAQRLPHPLQMLGMRVTGASEFAWAQCLKSRRSEAGKERATTPVAATCRKDLRVILGLAESLLPGILPASGASEDLRIQNAKQMPRNEWTGKE
jgi:hypothetical protein